MIFVFAFILVVLGFLAIIKIYELNDEYKAAQVNTASCGSTEYTDEEAYEDFLKVPELQLGIMDCYCL